MPYPSGTGTDIIEKMFACPICHADMTVSDDGRVLHCLCARKHCWDISSSGYVNFVGSGGGDSKEAVVARKRFLSLGHYKPAAELVLELISKYAPTGTVVDAGCGEGFYGKTVTEGGRALVGFDLSRPAVEAASKLRIKNAFFSVAGINQMPIKDNCAAVLTNIFAPCFESEFARVLKPEGVLIIVGAGSEHLAELKAALYESVTENTRRADLPTDMKLVETRRLTYDFTLDNAEQICDLFAMTPYYYRTSKESASRLTELEGLTVKADFDFFVYMKK
jgi:23S rRNA (guanine745-N1)-methyltransferase